MHPTEEKSAARQAIAQRLEHLTQGDREAESRSVCRRVLEALPPEPVPVCVYAALKSEVNLKLLIDALLHKEWALYFPRFEGKLVFRRVTDLKDLKPGQLGILEPPAEAPLLDPKAPAIALIPARAYARDGKRLGRGNGGYDIWIRARRAASPATKFWGVCFECQLLEHIPMEAHDERVDAVVTARGMGNPH